MIFNERLRRLRKERGLTQAQTAEHLSIAWRNYQRLEKDGNAPSFLTFVKAAEFFGVSLDYLAGRTDAREVNRGTCPPAGPEHRIILEAEVEAPDTVEPLLRRVISAATAGEIIPPQTSWPGRRQSSTWANGRRAALSGVCTKLSPPPPAGVK